MNIFAGTRAALLEEAKLVAPRNPNACVICANLILSTISRDHWHRVPMCRHYRAEDRDLQSKRALISLGILNAANADRVLRCVYCYCDGRDCFQTPESLMGPLLALVDRLIEAAQPYKDLSYVDVSDQDTEWKETTKNMATGLSIGFAKAVSYYADNPLTPLHSGRHHYVNTGILGLSQKQKGLARKRGAGKRNQEHVDNSLREAKKQKALSHSITGEIQAQIDVLARFLGPQTDETFQKAFNAVHPSRDFFPIKQT